MRRPAATCAPITAIAGAITLAVALAVSATPARASDPDCAPVASLLAADGAATQRIETARRKLSDLPACGYLVADAARTGLPPGPDRARIVDETLEASRDWAPTTGPQRTGYLKAAILAGSDPSLDLAKWRARVPTLVIEYGNLTTRRDVAELEAAIVRGYDPQRQNPFAIPDCERLPAISEQLTADLAAACAARKAFAMACEPVASAGAQPPATATRRCADSLKALLDRYPRAEANATVSAARRRVADLAQADAARAESERQAAAERARAEQQRRLEAERAERERAASSFGCTTSNVVAWLEQYGAYGDGELDTSIYAEPVQWIVNGNRTTKTRGELVSDEESFRRAFPVRQYSMKSASAAVSQGLCKLSMRVESMKQRVNGKIERGSVDIVFGIKVDGSAPLIVEQHINVLARW